MPFQGPRTQRKWLVVDLKIFPEEARHRKSCQLCHMLDESRICNSGRTSSATVWSLSSRILAKTFPAILSKEMPW